MHSLYIMCVNMYLRYIELHVHDRTVHVLCMQEEYYVTHQCFLSTRSLYLVVWNMTEGEEGITNLGPWLHNIQVCTLYPPPKDYHLLPYDRLPIGLITIIIFLIKGLN